MCHKQSVHIMVGKHVAIQHNLGSSKTVPGGVLELGCSILCNIHRTKISKAQVYLPTNYDIWSVALYSSLWYMSLLLSTVSHASARTLSHRASTVCFGAVTSFVPKCPTSMLRPHTTWLQCGLAAGHRESWGPLWHHTFIRSGFTKFMV